MVAVALEPEQIKSPDGTNPVPNLQGPRTPGTPCALRLSTRRSRRSAFTYKMSMKGPGTSCQMADFDFSRKEAGMPVPVGAQMDYREVGDL